MNDEILRKALLIRSVEEQLLEGYKDRKFGGTVHTCIGQEILPATLSYFCGEAPFVFSNHRGHGHFVAHGNNYVDLFREFLGKKGAPSSGIGGSQHLYAEKFLSNGIQGNTSSFAVGVGTKIPTILYLGDGTFGEGALYEAFNFAQLTKSRILFVVEDNQISQTTPSYRVIGGDFRTKFEAFGIESIEMDSADPSVLIEDISKVMNKWEEVNALGLIVRSYRLGSHSKGDDTRPLEIVKELPDPLRILAAQQGLIYENEMNSIKETVKEQWDSVITESNEEMPSLPNLIVDNFSDKFELNESDSRINEKIRASIEVSLSKGAALIGEDVITKWNDDDNPYGGAFGVSYGLSENYDTVIGTSISEAAIVGFSSGRAFVTGSLNIAEIMFADFSTLIVDQLINGVDKFRKMFGKHIPIPVIVRLPYGMGRGYGPTHSQSPFELFSSLTEVSVISYNPYIEYSRILEIVATKKKPALIFEPKSNYGDRISEWNNLLRGFDVRKISGHIINDLSVVNSDMPEVRVVTHGSTIKASLEAVRDLSVNFEMLIVSELYSETNMYNWLNKSLSPVVVLEEKNSKFGPLITVVSMCVSRLKDSVSVFSNEAIPNIPANSEWESSLMLSTEDAKLLIKEALL